MGISISLKGCRVFALYLPAFFSYTVFFLQLCFAYKGMLRDKVGLRFRYLNSLGIIESKSPEIDVLFTKSNR